MDVKIPDYLKYVLQFCGYENCHTISTIEENDFEYFEAEVRKGGIVQFFQEKVLEADIMKGSSKTIEDFEIVRGHRQLLMASVKKVKERLDEDGVEGFSVVSPKRKTAKKNVTALQRPEKNVPVPRKKPCKKLKVPIWELFSEQELGDDDDVFDVVKHHKRVLLSKAFSCLKSHNEDTYEKHLPIFKNTLSEDSLQLQKMSPESLKYTAKIKCPYCGEDTTVFHKLSSEYGSWNAFNFERHLSNKHEELSKRVSKSNEKTIEHSLEVKSNEKTIENSLEVMSEDANNGVKECIYSGLPVTNPSTNKLVHSGYDDANQANETTESKQEYNRIAGMTAPMPPKIGEVIIIEGVASENSVIKPMTQKFDFSKHYDANKKIEATNENDSNQNYLFVVVPPNTESPDQKYYDDVMLEDFSLCASDVTEANDEIEEVRDGYRLIFQNGGQTHDGTWDEHRLITTRNTCAFDSIFEIYATLYIGNSDYREHLEPDHIFFQSKFSALLHSYFNAYISTPTLQVSQISSAWKMLHQDRNVILKQVFSSKYYEQLPNLKTVNEITEINCLTGLGEFFAQLVSENKILSSAIESKTCHNCKITKTKMVPYLSIDGIDLELGNIQKHVISNMAKKRHCINCKKECVFIRALNKVLVIDIEPSGNKKKLYLQNLSQTIEPEPGNEYKLYAVIEFNPIQKHFTAHVKQKNGEWHLFDDLRYFDVKTDCTEEFFPYMLFFVTENDDKTFKNAFAKKISTERDIYDQAYDFNSFIGDVEQASSVDEPSTSTASRLKHTNNQYSDAWKIRRENGWRY